MIPALNVQITLPGIRKGIRVAFPVAVSVFAYGLTFGVLARQAGLSLGEAALMSVAVYAGSAQFIALGMWSSPLPAAALILTTLVVNLRHLLMGASIQPWLSRLGPRKAYPLAFFITDESWALSMRELEDGSNDLGFFIGAGVLIFAAWQMATLGGHLAGSAVPDPARWGLDFAFPAVFTALLVSMWKGRSNLLPWIAAALTAVIVSKFLPGKWYILLGGLVGSLAGALQHED